MRLTIPTRSHHVIRPVRPLRAALADTLSLRQQRIVAIAASAATGALEHLRTALARGLDGGDDCERGQGSDGARLCLLRLSPQLAWFADPLMQVLDERKARGIADTVGRDASPVCDSRDKHTRGAELLEKLSGAPADAPKTGYAAFAPIVDRYLKEHLFCDIFERDLLTWQERELAAVAILTALGEGAPADAAVALRHLPAPGAHGRPAPPDDGNRKRAERRRPPLHAAC